MIANVHIDIPHKSPAFLQHAIQAAKYAMAARTAESIDALRGIQECAKNAMRYSPLGSSEETDGFYWAIQETVSALVRQEVASSPITLFPRQEAARAV